MSESGRVAWITRDHHGRAVGIHAARPDAPAELTVEAHEWDTAFDIVRAEWLGGEAAGALTEELHEAIGARAAELEKATDEGGAA